MLTKEECLEALTEIKMYGSINIPLYSLEVIENLIGEHFSNPSLEFEELKEGMWVWDNKLKEWRKVIEKLIVGVSEGSEFYEDIYVKGTKVIRIGLHKFDWKDILFESKRFYRKEVQK